LKRKILAVVVMVAVIAGGSFGIDLSGPGVDPVVQDALMATMSMQQRVREGRYDNNVKSPQTGSKPSWYPNGTRPAVTAGAQTAMQGTSSPVPIGRCWIIPSITLSVGENSQGTLVNFNSGPSGILSDGTASGYAFVGRYGGQAVFPTVGLEVPEYGSVSGYYFPTSTNGLVNGFYANIVDVTNDRYYEARNVILTCGDSIGHTMPGVNGVTENTTPKATGTQLWPFIITRELREYKHASVRLVNKSFGSSHTSQWVTRIAEGYLTFGQNVGLIVVEQGVNDSSVPESEANYTNYCASFLHHRNEFYPNASLVFCSPPPILDYINRPTWTNYIGYTSNMVSNFGGGSSNVYYCYWSDAYATNDTAKYGDYVAPLGPTSTLIHPNAAGHRLLADKLKLTIATTSFYQNILGLTGNY
jgi:hypothetical protein